MSQGKPRDIRKICEDVLREKNTEHSARLLEELLEALEQRFRHRSRDITKRDA